ncbi:aldehyde reductase [Aaosphaeria arxii CBS 175.79]|uniref:Aldehyde reductase n=1 Tax=Aaosphaeria arxii CBS 175.79 TaxID=1450172 RepID=A0A6A5XTK2_9PLEO|nr:aldehyde reductase [Aaosphaeria arxii CBS 175.79]KAF2015574.1 aldehyde reductase [Aaosphaeria arxii CBS 175.79]
MSSLKIESPAIPCGSLIVVTGCTGFIGSHVADQVLAAGYQVRGTTRDSQRSSWVEDFFTQKYGADKFELVSIPDMTASNAFDEVVKGAAGFIHVAHDMTGSRDPSIAISLSVNMALNAVKSSNSAGLKRFVYTSSSFAVTQPKPNVDYIVNETTFNEEAVRKVEEQGEKAGGATVYAASKVHTERALAKWKEHHGSEITINCINPNANIGPILRPEQQGYPTSAAWVKNLWERNYAAMNKRAPEHFINVQDDAKLHVIALLHPDLSGTRLLGLAGSAPISEIAGILRKAYPNRKFDYIEDDGKNGCVNAEADRIEALLQEAYGHGYTSLEESVKANAKDLI